MVTTLNMPEGTNVSPDMYVGWLEEYDAADAAIAEAVAERKDLRQKIKAAGIPMKAFDRARSDAAKASAVREHEATWYQTMLAWQGKGVPVGGQAAFDLDDVTQAAAYERRLDVAEVEGFAAGKGGRSADECSWRPGTEGAQRWHSGWQSGQAESAKKLGDGDNDAPPVKRARGRPQGSKNNKVAKSANPAKTKRVPKLTNGNGAHVGDDRL